MQFQIKVVIKSYIPHISCKEQTALIKINVKFEAAKTNKQQVSHPKS